MMRTLGSRKVRLLFSLIALAVLARCGGDDSTNNACSNLTGTPWTPSIPGAGASNHVGGISVATSNQTASARVRGLSEPTSTSDEAVFTIDMTQDLGAYGSLTLMAQVQNYPSSLAGSAFAVLTSLNDGTNELVNMPRNGTGGDCAQSGYFTCDAGGNCSDNSACAPSWPSAFYSRSHWEQFQIPTDSGTNSPSINTFPTCVSTGGTIGSATVPACAFTTVPFFVSTNHLRTGTYTARFALLADSYASMSSATNATVSLSVTKKSASVATMGAVDLNVIIAGSQNVSDSRTAKGQQNLNTLIARVGSILGANGGPTLGSVQAVEACSTNDAPQIEDLPTLFASSGSLAPAGTSGKAINIFLVQSITDDSLNSAFTILGYDGAIGGPPANGTASSGVTVSTFGNLAQLNAGCSGTGVCAAATYDANFNDLSEAVAHEIGHYFGLNHLSESDGTEHDGILDTPFCTTTDGTSLNVITGDSCRTRDSSVFSPTGKTCLQDCGSYNAAQGSYCSTAVECEFNYLMWWTTKNFTPGSATGDGNMFSTDQMTRIQRGPMLQ